MRLLTALVLAAACVSSGAVEAGRASSDFERRPIAVPQRVYIWQRVWSPALSRDMTAHASVFSGVDVLAAEIAFLDTNPTTVYTAPDWNVLKGTTRPVGLVVRIGPCKSPWDRESTETKAVVAAVRRVIANARSNGVVPTEMQFDFDAATSRLREYRRLVKVVREAAAPSRIVITALPTWFGSADFRTLAAEAGCYVLQVHSLERPRLFSDEVTLCDPGRAEQWVRQASALGIPFRVALPSYGYRMAFDAAGQFCGLEAEGPARSWPPGVRTKTVWSFPTEIGRLVKSIASSSPPSCEGLCWFRFPAVGDDLAWRWVTLAAVMRGETPRPELVLNATPGPNGLVDLSLRNAGTDRGDLRSFRLSWPAARLIAADAIAGWTVSRDGEHAVRVNPPPRSEPKSLQPDESVRIGWLRLDAPTPIAAEPL